MRSCLEASETRCATFGSEIVLIRGGAGPEGTWAKLVGFMEVSIGHAASERPLGLVVWASVMDFINSA